MGPGLEASTESLSIRAAVSDKSAPSRPDQLVAAPKPATRPAIAGWLLLLPLVVLFGYLVVHVYARINPFQGFDYQGHLDYIRYVDLTASIPLANQGWEMYHPPAYWVLGALLFEALHRLGATLTLTDAGQAISTAAWFLEGLVAAALVRMLGGNSIGAAAAAALSWLLIGQSIVGTALYNETLTGLGVGILLLGAALSHRGSRLGLVMIGTGFALAVLSKYSGLLAALAVTPLLLWWTRARWKPTVLALLPGGVLAGLFYGRNVLVFGNPIPSNIELFNLRAWDPLGWGHPAGYFTSVSAGYCAATHSFWMGIWKWLWATDCYPMSPWRNVVETKLLAIALATTVLMLAALAWTTWRGRANLGMLMLPLAFLVIFAGFTVYNLHWPAVSSDKGLYLLAGFVPLAASVGLFVDRLTRSPASRLVSYGLILGWSVFMVHAALG